MQFLEPFEKFVAWVAGAIAGKKAAQVVDNGSTVVNNSPVGQLFNQVILTGITSSLSTAKNITPAEQAVIVDVLQGVPPAADPYTYSSGLLSAVSTIPSSQISPSAAMLIELSIETATATYIASHPAPASLLAPTEILLPPVKEPAKKQAVTPTETKKDTDNSDNSDNGGITPFIEAPIYNPESIG